MREGTATDGTTTSLVDSTLYGLGDWQGGMVFILSGDQAGNSRYVYANKKDTFTWDDALDGAIEAGDRYAVMSKEVPRDLLLGSVKAAQDYFLTQYENTSLVQDSDEAVYTIPSAVLQADGYAGLYRVEVARQSESPYDWMKPNRHWEEMGDELRFAYRARPLYDGFPIRLTYYAYLALSDESDEIPLDVSYDGLYWRALIELTASLRNLRPSDAGARISDLFQEAQIEWQRRVPPRPRKADNLALY